MSRVPEWEARSALLEFYSSRAVAHASYFMASIFGIVALLTICQNIGNPLQSIKCWIAVVLWSGAYLIFAVLGWWTLHQFNNYATYADKLRACAFVEKSNLEDIEYVVGKNDERAKRFWIQFLTRVRDDAKARVDKEEEAKIAKRDLERAEKNLKKMLSEEKFSFYYYDLYWTRKLEKTLIRKYVLTEKEEPVKLRFAWLRNLTQLTHIYQLLISLLAILAFYLILAR